MGDRKLLAWAGAAGVLAALVAFLYLQSVRRTYVSFAETKPVVVARKYIPAWSRIDQEMVEVVQAPGNAVQPGALPEATRAAGQLAVAPIAEGEQVLANKLATTGSQLSSTIPKGMRGITVAVDGSSTHAGLLRPGDSVDVLTTLEVNQGGKALTVSGTLLQDVRVVAVGSRFTNEQNGASAEVGGESVTMAVPPEDAEVLTFAEERGKLRLTLRAPGDHVRSSSKVVSFKAIVDSLLANPGADRP